MKLNKKNIRPLNNKGFSLAEIMIVLVIIGAIMAIILPKIEDGRQNSNVRNTKIKMTEIENKINEYQADCGKLPTSLEFIYTDSADCKNWTSNPKNKKLTMDEWNTPMEYEVSGNGFNLKSYGKDKKEGGSSFDKDIYSPGSAANEE